jgi:membrane protease YdiL (CAAX protease family)
MELILSSITTAIGNLIVFSFIPLIWWFIKHRKNEGFFKWIGLYKLKLKSKWWVLIIFGVIYYFFYDFDYTQLFDQSTIENIGNSSSVAVNAFSGIGVMAILPALITNFIANGLSEEIMYRGFLCKRLCNKLGVVKGIIIQAVLFGLMHNLLCILAGLDVGLWFHIVLFTFTGVGALLLGLLNEKIYNGSIVPSILLHGAGNFIASMLVAFA